MLVIQYKPFITNPFKGTSLLEVYSVQWTDEIKTSVCNCKWCNCKRTRGNIGEMSKRQGGAHNCGLPELIAIVNRLGILCARENICFLNLI